MSTAACARACARNGSTAATIAPAVEMAASTCAPTIDASGIGRRVASHGGSDPQNADLTPPPSARRTAPFIALESGLAFEVVVHEGPS